MKSHVAVFYVGSSLTSESELVWCGGKITYMLGCNPRATPVSHLGGLIGEEDRCTEFRQALENRDCTANAQDSIPADRVVASTPGSTKSVPGLGLRGHST